MSNSNPFNTTDFSISKWLHDPPYANGTIEEELQCYGLPYGGIGFASHLLTYYTIICLSYQRSPWWPFKQMHHKWFDATLATFGLLASVILTALTIVRCRNRWQFIAMATWKMLLSITFGMLSFHAAMLVDGRERKGYAGVDGGYYLGRGTVEAIRDKNYKKVLWWLLLYFPGVCAGLVGLISLVRSEIGHNREVEIVTEVFGSVIAIPTGMMLIFGLMLICTDRRKSGGGKSIIWAFIICVFMAGSLFALYSDWVLGAIAHNLAGWPSGDVAPMYWAYIVVKRLPAFSW